MPPKSKLPVAPKKQKSSLTWLAILFSLVAFVAAMLLQTVPTFTLTDTTCRWVSCLTSDSHVEHLWRAAQHQAAHFPSVGSAAYNRSMFWGTYRPNVLVGVKSRATHPLLVGVAWFDTQGVFGVKHDAVDGNTLLFRWEMHDGVSFGRQRIVDAENKVEVVVDFLKTASGDGWNLRVTGRRQTGHPLAVVVYVVQEGGDQRGPLRVVAEDDAMLVDDDSLRHALQRKPNAVAITGHLDKQSTISGRGGRHFDGEPFAIVVSDECPMFAGGNNTAPWKVSTFSGPPGSSWRFDMRKISARAHLTDKNNGKHNIMVLRKVFTSDFRVEIALASRPAFDHEPLATSAEERQASALYRAAHVPLVFLTSCQFTTLFDKHVEAFREHFSKRFLPASQFQSHRDDTTAEAPHRRRTLVDVRSSLEGLSYMALSNLLGSMGYWEGPYLRVTEAIDELSDQRGVEVKSLPQSEGPLVTETSYHVKLFSGTPSRAKFPRGFLWDEGFHQLLVGKWNPEVSKDVLRHWLLSAREESGWIPREQILGSESRSRVPTEFAAQHPLHANPPSMVLQLQNFAMALSDGSLSEEAKERQLEFLQSVQPSLRSWRDWFHRTQCGGAANCSHVPRPSLVGPPAQNVAEELQYRWRSRNHFHLLACGLDDYPRPVCKGHHQKELHVDLMSWVSLMTQTIDRIEQQVQEHQQKETEQSVIKGGSSSSLVDWEAQLTNVHWDEAAQRFADVTGCEHVVRKSTAGKQQPTYASMKFSPYVGYVSLFPFLSMTINNATRARAVLRLARDELSTGFGLASLSVASRRLLDHHHQAHENYWTGPIWMNINYLFLRALKKKYMDLLGDEAQQFYTQLREDLLVNVATQYEATGTLWENYHWETGRGQGTAPFTGWTSLILLILGEEY